MSIKKSIAQQGMKLMSDPRVLKLMQDERFMKLMMAAMAVPGRVQNFTDEQKENIAKSLGLATEKEVKDLQRKIRGLESELANAKKG